MIWPDIVNGCYEFLGAPFILLSVLKLHRDKEVKGVSWIAIVFFTTWGYWNLFYYPHLGQWVSFAGGIALVGVNTLWLCQIALYSLRGPPMDE